MKLIRPIFIVFLLTLSLVACSNEKDNSTTNDNETTDKSEVNNSINEAGEETIYYQIDDDDFVIDRPLEEEFSDIREVSKAIERYFSFINARSESDNEESIINEGTLAILDIISATQADIDTHLPTMISYFSFAQIEKYSMTNMERINDNLYLVRGKKIIREEFVNDEVNFNKLEFSPYVYRLDGEFKLALVKDRIPESLYDNFDDIPENYDPPLRWNQN